MIEFTLRELSPSTDWYEVSGGMAPDEIQYTIRTDEQKIQQQDSLTALLGLYLAAEDGSDADVGELAAYELQESDDTVQLGGRVFSDVITIVGDTETLHRAMRPFLSTLFERLDEQSTSSQRNEAFAYLSSTFGVDMDTIYTDLV
ncbi:hypothetical protein Halru_0904 [Halovivax ruber XH-70]|uniref:Uncharacterized protein n=1 Tax=Halovivax ruber (strain DSM 18193 / JCM 13892 / XH-70) TaxID=797302 RepID=L0I7H9_HALRX|nr:hypothetical protein [Halovivax ruber]AGB15525.1 hypothetical protein Halru_0904 [Halovivax ruber XH-70]